MRKIVLFGILLLFVFCFAKGQEVKNKVFEENKAMKGKKIRWCPYLGTSEK